MPRRATIHLADDTLAILGDPPEPSLSGRIARIVEAYALACKALGIDTREAEATRLERAALRYRAICQEATPALSEAEWSLLCDVLSGTWAFAGHTGTDLDLEIADTDPATAEKWGVDLPALVARLRTLDYPARCAIVEVVTRFWHTDDRLADLGAQLRNAGARIPALQPFEDRAAKFKEIAS